MKKISMIIMLIAILFCNVYAQENIILNVNTSSGCNVQINISNDAKTEELLEKINSIYQGYNISNVKYNSIALASLKTLEEQGIENGATITLESSVEHKYVDQGITIMPTCTKDGEQTYKCSNCSAEKKVKVEKLGHALDNKKVVNPTCTKDGYISEKCIRCDYEKKTVIEKTGHVFGVWDVTKEPTCKEEGQMSRKCVKCGKVETSVAEKIKHDIIEEKIEPTCTKVGFIIHKCSYDCGYIENKTQILALGHNMTEWATNVEPTLVENGERIRKCKNEGCDYVETEKIPSLAAGGSQAEVVDGIVDELKKDENKGKLFIVIGIIILPIIYVIIRDIYMVEITQIKKKKKIQKEEKNKKKSKEENKEKNK